MNARLVKYLASAGGCIFSFKCMCNFEEINKRYGTYLYRYGAYLYVCYLRETMHLNQRMKLLSEKYFVTGGIF